MKLVKTILLSLMVMASLLLPKASIAGDHDALNDDKLLEKVKRYQAETTLHQETSDLIVDTAFEGKGSDFVETHIDNKTNNDVIKKNLAEAIYSAMPKVVDEEVKLATEEDAKPFALYLKEVAKDWTPEKVGEVYEKLKSDFPCDLPDAKAKDCETYNYKAEKNPQADFAKRGLWVLVNNWGKDKDGKSRDKKPNDPEMLALYEALKPAQLAHIKEAKKLAADVKLCAESGNTAACQSIFGENGLGKKPMEAIDQLLHSSSKWAQNLGMNALKAAAPNGEMLFKNPKGEPVYLKMPDKVQGLMNMVKDPWFANVEFAVAGNTPFDAKTAKRVKWDGTTKKIVPVTPAPEAAPGGAAGGAVAGQAAGTDNQAKVASGDVQSIKADRCLSCHVPGKQGPIKNMENAAKFVANRRMPPESSTQAKSITDEERSLLEKHFVSGGV